MPHASNGFRRRVAPAVLLASAGPAAGDRAAVVPGHHPGGAFFSIASASKTLARGGAPAVLDPYGDDRVARTMQPGGWGLDDLVVLDRGGEGWTRHGSFLHRPLASVPRLAPGATTAVLIGPEGYAEWRVVAAEAAPLTVRIAGARAWALHGPSRSTAPRATASRSPWTEGEGGDPSGGRLHVGRGLPGRVRRNVHGAARARSSREGHGAGPAAVR